MYTSSKNNVKSLFSEAKEHLLINLSDHSIPLLSSISKIDVENFDVTEIEKTFMMLEKFLSNSENPQKVNLVSLRRKICKKFGFQLLVENYDQLVNNFNRILRNVRRQFPKFALAQESHNRHFGVDAIVSCMLKKCLDEEIEEWFDGSGNERFTDINDMKIQLREFYNEQYKQDNIESKTKYLMKSYSSNYLKALDLLSPGMRTVINYTGFSNGLYDPINHFLRGVRENKHNLTNMSHSFTEFACNLILPFYLHSDIVVYRGDKQTLSSESMTIKGFYSTALNVYSASRFTKEGGRLMKINVSKGTPILPIILDRDDECEFALLPGTTLKRVSKTDFETGHYVEYDVVKNPPRILEQEEATIMRNTIVDQYKKRNFFVKNIVDGLPTEEDITQFNIDLVNRKYSCDW